MGAFSSFTHHSSSTTPASNGRSNMSPNFPSLAIRSRLRNSTSSMPPAPPPPKGPPPPIPAGSSPSRSRSPAKSRWNRRSRPPIPRIHSMVPARERVELGVHIMDDGWALVHQKNDAGLPPTPPLSPDAEPLALPNPLIDAPLDTKVVSYPSTPQTHIGIGHNPDSLGVLDSTRHRHPTPQGLNALVNLPGHNLHKLEDLQTLDMIPPRGQSFDGPRQPQSTSADGPLPSAFLRPPPGRPVSVITPPPTQAPVSVLRRQSLPPGLDTGPRPSIKFAEDPMRSDRAARKATVASLNESLRLQRSYASLQECHAELYDAAFDARNEITRLRAKLTHSQDVMEHLISWGLAMQTENEILREQIPDAMNTMGPVSIKTAEQLRALFDHNLDE